MFLGWQSHRILFDLLPGGTVKMCDANTTCTGTKPEVADTVDRADADKAEKTNTMYCWH